MCVGQCSQLLIHFVFNSLVFASIFGITSIVNVRGESELSKSCTPRGGGGGGGGGYKPPTEWTRAVNRRQRAAGVRHCSPLAEEHVFLICLTGKLRLSSILCT